MKIVSLRRHNRIRSPYERNPYRPISRMEIDLWDLRRGFTFARDDALRSGQSPNAAAALVREQHHTTTSLISDKSQTDVQEDTTPTAVIHGQIDTDAATANGIDHRAISPVEITPVNVNHSPVLQQASTACDVSVDSQTLSEGRASYDAEGSRSREPTVHAVAHPDEQSKGGVDAQARGEKVLQILARSEAPSPVRVLASIIRASLRDLCASGGKNELVDGGQQVAQDQGGIISSKHKLRKHGVEMTCFRSIGASMLSTPSLDGRAMPGDVYLHMGAGTAQLWYKNLDGAWVTAQAGMDHPAYPDYCLNLSSDLWGRWVLKKTVSTYKGREKASSLLPLGLRMFRL
ncbi:unnamed protein product [Peniophora sp. CBMAI 1063]|nr:unnamed protein product [Peniophora sp. CBMAI 1063]